MTLKSKPAEFLTASDLSQYPVWEFVNDCSADSDTLVCPFLRLPTNDLNNKLVGTEVRLANDNLIWAILENIVVQSPRETRHFLLITFLKDSGARFSMSRYHDPDYEAFGPPALAHFLGLPIDDVFPISYDVSRFADGDPDALTAEIQKKPTETLSEFELIAMASG